MTSESNRKSHQTEERTGIILAAGFGSRLAGTVNDTELKPLTPVAGKPLLIRTLESLRKAGCRRVVTVLGYKSGEIREALTTLYKGDQELLFAHNPYYDRQNGLSLLAASDFVGNEFVMTMADHVFSDDVMHLAAGHRPPEQGATLMVDYNIGGVFDLDDATKVKTDDDGAIIRIGKTLADYNCIDTGVFIGTRAMIDRAYARYERDGDASISDVVQELADRGTMNTLNIKNGFWQDVDTPEMLEQAERRLSEW